MKRLIFGLTLLATLSWQAQAQYYEIANQLTSLISPILSGSTSYKGFVELTGTAGLGDSRANMVGISTSQGFQYSSWFYMGVGLGVDVAMAQQPKTWRPSPGYDYMNYSNTDTKVMVPLFSDFRFNIGSLETTSFFIDLKVGATWLIGSDYLRMGDAFMSNATQFYFRPSIGLRIPVKKGDTRHAIDVGVAYQLITSNNNYYWSDNSVTLNNLGLSISYEW